ncbi:MAG: helix-turn-helix domain-containing protein [Bacteroidales bacterium]|nr:helix-turn-helix domain-containing protein [Bacteroidales bacterium]
MAGLALFSVKLLAINTLVPRNLESLSSANVSCSIQDDKGAIWLNSNRGVFRYNGQSAEYMSHQLGQTVLIPDAAGHLYGLDSDCLVRFDIHTLERTRLPVGDEPSLEDAAMAAQDATLLVGIGNRLYRTGGSDISLLRELDPDCRISALAFDRDRRLLIGTARNGLLQEDGSAVLVEAENITTLYTEDPLFLWVGTQGRGLFRYDRRSGHTVCFGLNTLYDIRTITQYDGEYLLVGTSDGLYRCSSDGALSRETLNGVSSCPIRNLSQDRDNNLWIATFYNGLVLSEHNSASYVKLDADKEIQNVKGLVRDESGHVFLATDGNGIWVSDATTRSFHELKGTQGVKFQCVYFDRASGCLWASDFRGQVISILPEDGRTRLFPVRMKTKGKPENITAIRRLGDQLYLAGIGGVYLFDPAKEKEVVRRVEGMDRRAFDLEIGRDGAVWVASYGLYRIQDGQAVKIPVGGPRWTDVSTISDIELDSEGRMWIAYFRRGAACKDGDRTELFNSQSCGLLDEFCQSIVPLGSGHALVSTGREISLLSPGGRTLRFPTGRSHYLLRLDDGKVLAAGNEGIRIIDPARIEEGRSHGLYIDRFSANGRRVKGSVLPPEDTGFAFEITSFDYSETAALSYFYRLRNFDEDWKPFDLKQNVTFTNMKPGRYILEVEARTYASEVIASDSFSFRLKPHWWATKLALALFSLLALTLAAVIINSIRIRKKLTREIVQKEKENKEKTLFFIDLSRQLRTPLNLAIGNLERFFYQYGARTPGIENIENVYKTSKEMRQLISGYVDTRLNEIEDENDAARYVVKGAKILNAATGIVERNLFSPDLGVGLLCKELNMGKTNLTKRLKDASGMTPRTFIEDIKLKHAARMLDDGVYRISEIAELLNFSSPKYFTQRFFLKFGVSPRDYKRKNVSSQPE